MKIKYEITKWKSHELSMLKIFQNKYLKIVRLLLHRILYVIWYNVFFFFAFLPTILEVGLHPYPSWPPPLVSIFHIPCTHTHQQPSHSCQSYRLYFGLLPLFPSTFIFTTTWLRGTFFPVPFGFRRHSVAFRLNDFGFETKCLYNIIF